MNLQNSVRKSVKHFDRGVAKPKASCPIEIFQLSAFAENLPLHPVRCCTNGHGNKPLW
jgi:hypothetical protein